MPFPQRLTEGYADFRAGRFAADRQRYERLAERGQRPEVMILACCDSRAAPETIFDAVPGELFVVRNVANLVPPYETDGTYHGASAAVEFGVRVLKVRDLVVMGHGRCGGIQAYLNGVSRMGSTDFIGRWIDLIAPAADPVADDPMEAAQRQRSVELRSIRNVLGNLRTFPWIKAAEAEGSLRLHGAWFDIAAGELLVLDPLTGRFVVLPEKTG